MDVQILNALKIDDSTIPSQLALDSVHVCIQMVDDGMSVDDAAKQLLDAAKQNVTPQEIAKFLRERAFQSSEAIASTINQADERLQKDAILAYLSAVGEGLQHHLQNNTARQVANEVIDLGEFSILEEMKKLPPRVPSPKALPSNSESK